MELALLRQRDRFKIPHKPYSNGIRCESIPSCIEGRIQRGVALVFHEHPKGVGKLHPRSNQKVESK